jgi:hypothetical protein
MGRLRPHLDIGAAWLSPDLGVDVPVAGHVLARQQVAVGGVAELHVQVVGLADQVHRQIHSTLPAVLDVGGTDREAGSTKRRTKLGWWGKPVYDPVPGDAADVERSSSPLEATRNRLSDGGG